MARDQVMELFPVRAMVCEDVLPVAECQRLAQVALAVHHRLHPYRLPYRRPDPVSLDELMPETFAPLFDLVRDKVRVGFGCEVAHMVGRELVLWNGTHMPPHVEHNDLSAILWLDYTAEPDPEHWDYNGLVTLVNPSGPWGFKDLPWEPPRSQMIEPRVGALALFPSYVTHYIHPYRGSRPGVEIHFEMDLRPAHGRG